MGDSDTVHAWIVWIKTCPWISHTLEIINLKTLNMIKWYASMIKVTVKYVLQLNVMALYFSCKTEKSVTMVSQNSTVCITLFQVRWNDHYDIPFLK